MEKTYIMIMPEYANNFQFVQETLHRLLAAELRIHILKKIQYKKEDVIEQFLDRSSEFNYTKIAKDLTNNLSYGLVVSSDDHTIKKVNKVIHKIESELEPDLEGEKSNLIIYTSSTEEAANKDINIFKRILRNNQDSKIYDREFIEKFF